MRDPRAELRKLTPKEKEWEETAEWALEEALEIKATAFDIRGPYGTLWFLADGEWHGSDIMLINMGGEWDAITKTLGRRGIYWRNSYSKVRDA
jgi:hypothetical protein